MKALEHYEIASQFDSEGKEEEALEHYLSAFQKLDELDIEDQKGLVLGLGSTYRWLGNLKKSEEVLNFGITRFPSIKSIESSWL